MRPILALLLLSATPTAQRAAPAPAPASASLERRVIYLESEVERLSSEKGERRSAFATMASDLEFKKCTDRLDEADLVMRELSGRLDKLGKKIEELERKEFDRELKERYR